MVYMTKKLADEASLSYTKEKGFVKGVNAQSLLVEGVAQVSHPSRLVER